MKKMLVVAMLVGGWLAGPLRAETVTEALFAEGIFDSLPDGQQIAYGHVRSGPEAADFHPIAEGSLLLVAGPAEDGARALKLSVDADGRRRQIIDFPASGGNPVLMLFLESTVRSMAAITGGSPFYIRNRIRESLGRGGEMRDATEVFAGVAVEAREVTLHPFAADPNRDRMGAFADLALRFVVAEAVPGRLMLLSADTPDAEAGYHETITLSDANAGAEGGE